MSRGLEHLRRNAIAYLALFIALGGAGAWAADKITSKEIKKNAVRAKHIKRDAVRTKHVKSGQIRSSELDVVEFDLASAQVTNPGSAGQVAFADDPSITIDAQAGDVIVVDARVDIRRDAGTGRCNVHIFFNAPDALSTTQRFAASESAAFETVYIDPFEATGVVSGTTSALASEAREIPVVEAGPHSFTFRYDQGNAGTDCSFRNRALWAGILR